MPGAGSTKVPSGPCSEPHPNIMSSVKAGRQRRIGTPCSKVDDPSSKYSASLETLAPAWTPRPIPRQACPGATPTYILLANPDAQSGGSGSSHRLTSDDRLEWIRRRPADASTCTRSPVRTPEACRTRARTCHRAHQCMPSPVGSARRDRSRWCRTPLRNGKSSRHCRGKEPPRRRSTGRRGCRRRHHTRRGREPSVEHRGQKGGAWQGSIGIVTGQPSRRHGRGTFSGRAQCSRPGAACGPTFCAQVIHPATSVRSGEAPYKPRSCFVSPARP
jgi:hypothetical protein